MQIVFHVVNRPADAEHDGEDDDDEDDDESYFTYRLLTIHFSIIFRPSYCTFNEIVVDFDVIVTFRSKTVMMMTKTKMRMAEILTMTRNTSTAMRMT